MGLKLALTSFGTYGDYRPYIALARRLVAAGHDAWLVGPEYMAKTAASYGVAFRSLGDYPASIIHDGVAAMLREPNELKHVDILVRATQPVIHAHGAAAIEATRDADAIVNHNVSFFGLVAAGVNEKPLLTAHLFPVLIPSSSFIIPGHDLTAPINWLVWALTMWLVRRGSDAQSNAILGHFGLPPRRDFMLRSAHSDRLNMLAFSEHVVPRDRRWSAHYRHTGYWFLDESIDDVDPALAAFVEAGPPPVVVSFGSMTGLDAARATRAVVDGVREAGCRAVLQAGVADLGRCELPSTILRVDFVPHAWLFPRASCVVHHGGAGTVAAALRAGVPSVIVHHLGDQQFWGRLLARRSLGPAPIAHRRFDARWLAATLTRVRDDAPLRARVRATAEAIQLEDGLGAAIRDIERALG